LEGRKGGEIEPETKWDSTPLKGENAERSRFQRKNKTYIGSVTKDPLNFTGTGKGSLLEQKEALEWGGPSLAKTKTVAPARARQELLQPKRGGVVWGLR